VEQMKKLGTAARILNRLKSSKTTILNQEIRLPLVDKALQNQSGVEKGKDYRQVESIMAYAPAQVGDVTWALITRMDESEVLKPINEFRKRLLVTAVGIILLTSLLSTFLARLFIEPIFQIINGLKQIVNGRFDRQIHLKSKDELSELARTANQLAGKLQAQHNIIATQENDNDNLLKTLLPASIVPRYKAGESLIAEKANNVSVVVVEIAGFNSRSMQLPAEQSVAYLNEIFSSFDAATLNQGVERIRVAGTNYIAVSGLLTPRLDHAKYALEYALSLQKIMAQFEQNNNVNFALRIGIEAGPVIAGVVGNQFMSYNIWGNTVIEGWVIASHALPNEVWVGETIRNRLGDLYCFEARPAIDIEGRSSKIAVWAVSRG
jgi:class 3 adenylate cyclase